MPDFNIPAMQVASNKHPQPAVQCIDAFSICAADAMVVVVAHAAFPCGTYVVLSEYTTGRHLYRLYGVRPDAYTRNNARDALSVLRSRHGARFPAVLLAAIGAHPRINPPPMPAPPELD